MSTYVTNDLTASYEDTPEAHKAVYDRMLAFFKEHEMFTGECIHQSDTTYEEAPNILTDIAEECFKFKVTYKE